MVGEGKSNSGGVCWFKVNQLIWMLSTKFIGNELIIEETS